MLRALWWHSQEAIMQKTYHGSCHCGAVTFAADIDLAEGTSRCNCSYCRKIRNWSAKVVNAEFREFNGQEALGSYVFAHGMGIDHGFCTRCGVTLFARGNIPEMGGAFLGVMLGTLDDVAEADLIAAPLVWNDGLHDAWWNVPDEVRHL
jgi:hypothetical protein